jgi:hypothetical protein
MASDESTEIHVLVRVALTLLVVGVLLLLGRLTLGWPVYPGPIEPLIGWLILAVLMGFATIVLWGWTFLSWVGDKVASMFWPSDKDFRIRPEYSIAEARAAQGRWEESIAAFRVDIEKFPEEAFPHTRIADILLERFQDRQGAMVELQAAMDKTKSDEAYYLIARRLVELHLRDPDRDGREQACALLREVQQRFPETKQAKAAAEMLANLDGDA